MLTEAQLNANRENAQLSTGPRTPEGKTRSSMNAFRHGLTGHIHVLIPEDQTAFTQHCTAIVDALKPEDALESALAQTVAADLWRIQRGQAVENCIPAQFQPDTPTEDPAGQPLAQAQAWAAHSLELDRLTVYSARLHRAVDRNLKQLDALQSRRKQVRDQIVNEQYLESRLDETRTALNRPGEPYRLEAHLDHSAIRNGFVFSSEELRSEIKRKERLEDARLMQKKLWEPFHMPDNWPRDYVSPFPCKTN